MVDKPHILMIAFPLQGHIIPLAHLAVKLASTGITITFVNTHSIHRQISSSSENADIFASARQSGLEITYTTITDGLPLSFDRSVNQEQFRECLVHAFPAHVDDLVGNLVVLDPPVNCLVTDTFFVGASMIADKYNLVNISFWTEPALVFSLYYHLDLLKLNGHFAQTVNRQDSIDYIPGVNSIEPKDLPSYLRCSDTTTTLIRIICKVFHDVKQADFILCNTIQELEHNTISAVRQKQPFYAIGPLFPPEFTEKVVETSLWTESSCTNWLNTKPPSSVLYISFGSLANASKQVIDEIANGLLLSKVSFIWVLRSNAVSPDDNYVLPLEFEDRVKNQGLIVTWCNQKEVLSHPAIGGFLTHCGWNSTLESIWCNIPMICYPLFTDQFTNRMLLVDEWKIGINLHDEELVTSVEVAEKINRLMNPNASDELTKNIKKVKHVLQNALAMNGSSQMNYENFVNDLRAKIQLKNIKQVL